MAAGGLRLGIVIILASISIRRTIHMSVMVVVVVGRRDDDIDTAIPRMEGKGWEIDIRGGIFLDGLDNVTFSPSDNRMELVVDFTRFGLQAALPMRKQGRRKR